MRVKPLPAEFIKAAETAEKDVLADKNNIRAIAVNIIIVAIADIMKYLKAPSSANLFLDHLDADKYRTDFRREGSCSYAFTLVLKRPDAELWARVEQALREHGVEFRRGLSGGGNQLRQPYLRDILGDEFDKYPNADHVHFYGCYIGNYPTLEKDKILSLCAILNAP